MAIDTRAFTTCNLGTLISGSINDDYIQGNGLIKTTGSVELSGIVVPEIGTSVTFSYERDGQTYDIPRALRVLSSFADPFRRTTQVELGCKLTYMQDLVEPLKWRPKDDPENDNVTAEDEQIITVPIFASSVMNRCLKKLGIIAASNPLTNRFSIGEFDYSAGYVNILSDLLVSESYCGYLDENETLQIINLRQSGGTGPFLQSSDLIDIASINSGELPGEAVIVNYSTLKLKNSENGAVQVEDDALKDVDPALQSFVSWDQSKNISVELLSLEYTNVNTKAKTIRYYNALEFTDEVSTYKEFTTYKDVLVKPENEDNQAVDLPDRIERQVDEVKRLIDKKVEISKQSLVRVAPTCVSQLLTLGIEPGNDLIDEVTLTTYYYDINGEQVFQVSDKESSLIKAYASLDVPYLFMYDISTGDDIINRTFAYVTRITNPSGGETIQTNTIAIAFLNPYVAKRYISSRTTVETVKIGGTTKVITTEYVPFAETAVGQQVTKEQKDGIRTAAQALDYVKRMTALTKRKTSISITAEEPAPQQAPSESDIVNNRNVDKNNTNGTPDPNNGWRVENSSESTLAIGSFNAQRRKDFSMPYASDDYFSIGVLPGGQKLYSSAPSGAEAMARLFGRIQNKLLLGNRSGLNIQALPEKIPSTPFSPFVVEANGLSALYRSNGYGWTMDASGVIASVDALFDGAVGGTGDFWFPVAPGIVELPETPPVVNGQITVDTVVPVWNESALLSAITTTKVSVQSLAYALQSTKNIAVITRTLATLFDPYLIDPALIVYSQSSVYSPNTAATVAGMQNGEFEETSETGTDSDIVSWIQMAFGGTKRVKTVVIGCDFTSVLPGGWGPQYTENCDVEESIDGVNWTYLFNTGTFTQGIQQYQVDTLANYIRIVSSGFLAVTEFYALSVGDVTINLPATEALVTATIPESIGLYVFEITVPITSIVIAANEPTVATGASVFIDTSIINVAANLPTIAISLSIPVDASIINVAANTPTIATGSSIFIDTCIINIAANQVSIEAIAIVNVTTSGVSITAIAPEIITDTTYYGSFVKQVYGYDRDWLPDWWAD